MEASIITTYRCNAKCHMCNVWMHPTKAREEIKPDIIYKLPDLNFCNITGGEPFLRDDIMEFVEAATSKAKRVVISTNGYLTDRIVEVASRYRDIGIRVSIEGLPSANDELRGLKDGFDHGLRTLLQLQRLGLKDIGFGITVSDRNAEDMIELYHLAQSMDFEFATAAVHNSYYFHKGDNKLTEVDLATRNFEKLIDELLSTKKVKNWYRAYFNHGLINYIRGNKRLLPCEAGSEHIFVDPSGEVRPCNGMESKHWLDSFGNLNTQTWDEIWHGEKAEKIRERVRTCPKNCWMIGSVSPVMKKYIWKPSLWVLKTKLFGYKKGIRVAVLGTRGFPGAQGGVETHCEELYPRLVKLGAEVRVYGRKGYIDSNVKEYNGVEIKPLRAPKLKSLEAIYHTFRGIVSAALSRQRFDIVHIHAVGPSLLAPLARLMGKKVVVTNHGPDYNREKWGKLARRVMKAGENFGTRYANGVIAVSKDIASHLEQNYNRAVNYIPNGVNKPKIIPPGEYLNSLGVEHEKYFLTVARFVPEKGLHDLIEAFSKIKTDWKLVIAGDADHEDDYSRKIKRMANNDKRIILPGMIRGAKLAEVYSNAGLFVLPSYHEGLPIVLLEALSYDLKAICSDIPANTEVIGEEVFLFEPGDVTGLQARMSDYINGLIPNPIISPEERLEEYDWDMIAASTYKLYLEVTGEIHSAFEEEDINKVSLEKVLSEFDTVHRKNIKVVNKGSGFERISKR